MSDSDDDEDFAYYGTPVEQLDEDESIPRKAPRLEDQIAKDKQGRRRFHGAFTGGFSAGYFNSVGTKEGWTPSTFVSSKGQRAETKRVKPQDFMDDEDLGVFGISPQVIQATSNFDSNRDQVQRKRVLDPSGPIPGIPVLEEILRPASETVGVKLLRRLGWRPGQGVGPRVSRQQKRLSKKEKKRMYGCQGPQGGDVGNNSSDGDSCDSDNNTESKITFAPDDVDTLLLPQAKHNTFGMGYIPLDRTPVLGVAASLLNPTPLSFTEKKKKVLIRGQAFGVGAFEDVDDDIYATEDMSIYDFGEDKKQNSEKRDKNAYSQQDKAMFGLTEALKGFKLSSKPHNCIKSYPWPTLPSDFIPLHKPRRRRFERKENELQGLGRHDMTVKQRARSIEEQPKAVVEIRSGVKGYTPKVPPQNVMQKKSEKTLDTSEVDQLYEEFKSSEKKLGSDFKPFSKDPEKQKRYELYLRMKEKGQKGQFYLAQPRGMTEWEKEREVREFARAAQLFQPLTTTMATRFVTASVSDALPQLKDGLNVNVPKVDKTNAGSEEIALLARDTDDDQMKAARMKMYGQMTQTTQDWYPDRLLCRRFNVPNPFPESSFVGLRKTKKEKFSLFGMMNAEIEDTAGLQKPRHKSEQKIDVEEATHQEDGILEDHPETYGLKVPVDGPPTMDLFKAIFQDSDSDTDDDDKKTDDTKPTHKNVEAYHGTANLLPQKLTVLDENEENKSPVTEIQEDPVSRFLSSIRSDQGKQNNADNVTEKRKIDGRRKRVSRFEPQAEDGVHNIQYPNCPSLEPSISIQDSSQSTEQSNFRADLPKPVFVPKKKESVATKPTPSKGIFANVDFSALNSLWNSEASSSQETSTLNNIDQIQPKPGVENSLAEVKGAAHREVDSDSSTDPESEYGPAVPSHLRHQAQMVRSVPTTSVDLVQKLGEKHREKLNYSGWVEKNEGKEKKASKKHKHRDKHKHKKEKRKKEKKSKSHKEKKKKKKKQKHISSSSSSDSSPQSSE
ncbi:hypothetical protein Pmani_009503 [Petrolisthes manimaculis]|uniref:G-patch domain-containing protein n=1 Tax=Petrolisthes manimaculis TaxID=1843537 RepID=A0AAE1Q4S5_9EUCA|nr:hypothetical protein Pmani_009503 [Petrolisthes manimaculis]